MSRTMKDSGIEWIGEIPETWSTKRVKYIFTKKDAKAEQEDPVVLSLARSGVKVRDISSNEGQLAASYYNYNPVAIGDLLLNPMDLYSGANCSISKVEGVISPAYVNLRNKTGYNSVYYDYFFKTMYWSFALFSLGKGVSFDNRWTLGNDTLFNIKLPSPSLAEQNKIAMFLDEKCGAIDEIIRKTEQSIEEYKKLKQSVITEAVTKGIRPNRAMKDSNIEWIGEIPEDWEIRKTLHCLSMPITDGPHTTPQLFDAGIPFISAEAVSFGKGTIDFSHARGYISEEFYQECCLKYIPKLNDLLMIKSGATTGRVSIVDTEEKFTIWSPLAVFRVNPSILFYKFLFYFVQSQKYQKQLEDNWSFGTQQNIGMRVLEQLKITLPPLDEQREIAQYLDEKCSEIDVLIEKKQNFLTELANYKKSLIYEYVTGKKEVA